MFGEYSGLFYLEHTNVVFAYLCVSLGPLQPFSIQPFFFFSEIEWN